MVKKMKKIKKINNIMLGMLLCSGVLASCAANASAYAVSTNSITGFAVTFDTTKAKLTGYTNAGDTAELNGTEEGYGALKDAKAACVDCGYSNSFVSHGTATTYAYGDTLITNSNVVGGSGAASSIGEASLLTEGTGHGYGANTLTGTWKTNLGVTSPMAVTFSFWATPYMQAVTSGAGDSATAYSAMSISLVQNGVTAFYWAPDSLNQSLTPTSGVPYRPGASYFTMTTAPLLGTYSLNISMVNEATIEVVPVPAAAWLLGSGLIGLAGVVRRKKMPA